MIKFYKLHDGEILEVQIFQGSVDIRVIDCEDNSAQSITLDWDQIYTLKNDLLPKAIEAAKGMYWRKMNEL